MTNNFVKAKQDKYGNGKTNGRPKKKSTVLNADRRIYDIVSNEIFQTMYHIVFLNSQL